MCHPLPPGCPSCAAAEAQCNRMATQIQELERDVSSLLWLLARIREALGDHGKRTQTDLLDYCRALHETADPSQVDRLETMIRDQRTSGGAR